MPDIDDFNYPVVEFLKIEDFPTECERCGKPNSYNEICEDCESSIQGCEECHAEWYDDTSDFNRCVHSIWSDEHSGYIGCCDYDFHSDKGSEEYRDYLYNYVWQFYKNGRAIANCIREELLGN